MKSQTLKGDHFPRRINQYVPNMQYAADVSDSGVYRVSFGTPVVADVDFLVASVALTSGAAKTFTLANDDLTGTGSGAPFGRNVTITSGGANTRTVTVTGRDYLGQPMVETIDFAGAATVAGKKAFAFLDEISVDAEANTPTVSVGFGDVLGLPYRTIKVLSEEADGAVEATLGTLVGAVDTTATATTGDTRGTYDPQTTLDGATEITITAIADSNLVAQGTDPETYVGGLHGVPQYYA